MPPVRGMAEEVWSENDRSRVFLNASRLALRDGQLSNGEKRILVKLAHALSLEAVSYTHLTLPTILRV